MHVRPLTERIAECVREWEIAVQRTQETPSSFIAFGTRGPEQVVLKVVRQSGDEWRGGEVLAAFEGRGAARVIQHVEGAVLLERLLPGTPLASLSLGGRDEEATEILAQVIHRMSQAQASPNTFAPVADW